MIHRREVDLDYIKQFALLVLESDDLKPVECIQYTLA